MYQERFWKGYEWVIESCYTQATGNEKEKTLDLTLRQSVEGSESYGSASSLTRSQGKAERAWSEH